MTIFGENRDAGMSKAGMLPLNDTPRWDTVSAAIVGHGYRPVKQITTILRALPANLRRLSTHSEANSIRHLAWCMRSIAQDMIENVTHTVDVRISDIGMR